VGGIVVGTVVTPPVSAAVGVAVGVPLPGPVVVHPAKDAKPTIRRDRIMKMHICFFKAIGVRFTFLFRINEYCYFLLMLNQLYYQLIIPAGNISSDPVVIFFYRRMI
jgi:hypothetical protein